MRRFSTLVLLAAALCGGAAAALSYSSSPSYQAEGFYVVPPGTGQASAESLTPFDAERIARTYAVVLAEDEQLLRALGGPLDRDPADLSDRIATVSLPNSSAVRVTYEGESASEVREFFTVLTGLVQQPAPPTANLRPGTLRLLQAADEVVRTGGGTVAAPIAGTVAGLLLGLGMAMLLTRARPVVRRAEDLREAGGPSVLDVHAGEPHSVSALAVRLLQDTPEGAWLAVVGSSPEADPQLDDLAQRLRLSTAVLVREQLLPEHSTASYWKAALSTTGEAERTAQDADRTLLVVPAGSGLREVATRLADLRDLGVDDVVLAVVHRDRNRSPKAAEGLSPLSAALQSVGAADDDVRRAT